MDAMKWASTALSSPPNYHALLKVNSFCRQKLLTFNTWVITPVERGMYRPIRHGRSLE